MSAARWMMSDSDRVASPSYPLSCRGEGAPRVCGASRLRATRVIEPRRFSRHRRADHQEHPMLKIPGHGRYAYSPIVKRPDYSWPGGKRLAFYVALNIEHFAFNSGIGMDPH